MRSAVDRCRVAELLVQGLAVREKRFTRERWVGISDERTCINRAAIVWEVRV